MASHCKACKAPVFWAVTERGKIMPVDVAAVPEGNIEITGQRGPEDDYPGTTTIRVLKKAELADALPGMDATERFVSHFYTCPYAPDFRKDDD